MSQAAQGQAQEARPSYGEERGGSLRTPDALVDDFLDPSAAIALDADLSTTASPSSPRHVCIPPAHPDNTASGSSSAIQSLTSASTLSNLSNLEGKLDLSDTDPAARQGLLRDSFFDQWKEDNTGVETESPEEMQKNDPLGTQIWKLYHKTKGQLPNSERLENLSWRMMSMNLRRKEMERRQGYVAVVRM